MERLEQIEIVEHKEHFVVSNHGIYFKVGKNEGNILCRLKNGCSTEVIAREQNVKQDDVEEFLNQLEEQGVIGGGKKQKKNIFFLKVPVLNADGLFNQVLDKYQKNRKGFHILFILMNFCMLIGLSFFMAQFFDIFTLSNIKLEIWQYVLLYGAFFATVGMHEFAHGFTCKYFGCKVGTMGFMFIFFAPALYCDISGIRMIENKKHQICTSMAGLYVNVMFMGLATILYTLAPSGIVAAYIILNFTTIISNVIPFIRLDGYWILSFATGITNLYKKSLKSVRNVFKKTSGQETFVAVYGILNYCIIFAASVTGVTSIVQVVMSLQKTFF